MNSELLQQTFSEEIYRIPGKVLIVIPQEWAELNPTEIELLSKILAAVNLTIDTVQIITTKQVDLNDLITISPSVLLSFGSEIKQADAPYKVKIWNGIPVLKTDTLSLLDEGKKKNLWVGLRQIFLESGSDK